MDSSSPGVSDPWSPLDDSLALLSVGTNGAGGRHLMAAPFRVLGVGAGVFLIGFFL
jgi:hypothetical protein